MTPGTPSPDARVTLPKIGTAFPGQPGIYAGLIAGGAETGSDAHLIVLDGDRGNLTWPKALDWAESVGGRLPTRREQAAANLRRMHAERRLPQYRSERQPVPCALQEVWR